MNELVGDARGASAGSLKRESPRRRALPVRLRGLALLLAVGAVAEAVFALRGGDLGTGVIAGGWAAAAVVLWRGTTGSVPLADARNGRPDARAIVVQMQTSAIVFALVLLPMLLFSA